MPAEGLEPSLGLVPGVPGPAVIAHGGGNSPARARHDILAGADLLEVDVWVHGRRLEARHERALYPLPLFFDKWYIRFAPRRPFGLIELLTETAGSTPVFLDLKNGRGSAARLMREALNAVGPGERVLVSSQLWHVLREIQELVPEIETYYSIDVPPKLALFLSVDGREHEAHGVSCQERLLTERVVCELKRRRLRVVAWTVDDLERAKQLLSWGVDAITTHRVADVRSLVQATR